MALDVVGSKAALVALSRGDLGALEMLLRRGYVTDPIDETGATVKLTFDKHGNQLTRCGRAAGQAITLPDSVGSQVEFKLFINVTITSNTTTIKVNNSTDVMVGEVLTNLAAGAAGASFTEAATGTDDTITMNGTTQGGILGSYVTLKDIQKGFYLVKASLIGSGALATTLSATV